MVRVRVGFGIRGNTFSAKRIFQQD